MNTDNPGQNQSSAPGASQGANDQPAGAQSGPAAPMAPGDEAPQGTPGTGEDICPDCGGSGKQGAVQCATCQGTGLLTVGIGGA